MKPFDQRGTFFDPEHSPHIQRLAVRGAGFTMCSAASQFGIHILSTAVLARILTPDDFGLITMVTTFSLLVSNFGLVGITEAIIQRETIDHGLMSNLFWINLAAGALLTIAFAATGSFMARFYGDDRVATVTIGMSFTILLTSASVVHLALLKRALLFSVTSINDILARAASVLVSISLAVFGFGYWALVVGAVTLPLSTSIGAWLSCQWLPGTPRRAPGTGAMIRFSINTYARFAMNYFARNTDKIILGWRFSAELLGLYKKAYDLFALSTNQTVAPLTNVAVAAFSRLTGDLCRYNRYLSKATEVFAFLGMALSALLTLIGPDLVVLLLGPGWERTGHIFSLLGPGIGAMVIYYMHGWIHLSLGRPDRWVRWGIVEFGVTVFLFACGLSWGPEGIALAWTLSYWILLLPAFLYAGRPIQFTPQQLISPIWKYAVGSLCAGFLTAWLIHQTPFIPHVPGLLRTVVRIGVASVIFVAFYVGAILLFCRGLGPFRLVGSVLEKTNLRALFTSRPVSSGQPSEHSTDL